MERRAMDYDRTPDFPAIDTRLSGAGYDEFWMLGISDGRPAGTEVLRPAGARLLVARRSRRCLSSRARLLSRRRADLGRRFGDRAASQHAREQGRNSDLRRRVTSLKGPVAALPLRHMIHPGFHASFRLAMNSDKLMVKPGSKAEAGRPRPRRNVRLHQRQAERRAREASGQAGRAPGAALRGKEARAC